MRVTKNKNIVLHLAANVGGIGLNKEKPAELFYDNALMGIQLMEAARQNKVEKFVTIGTVCAYPKNAPIPFKESSLWNGYPEDVTAPYGMAKKMMLVQGTSYRQQYGFKSIFLIPVNLYGPGDHFNSKYSHVMPALIKRIVDAKMNNLPKIVVWGSGKATREFLYADDAAEGILLATEKYDKLDAVNLGSSQEMPIRRLVQIICEVVGYEGKIVWDKTKPDGVMRRKLNVSKASKEFGFKSKTNLKKGIEATVNWYIKNSLSK
jgi:GDP-L-fucose synthase